MTTDTIGGVWSYCLELLRALPPNRCEVLLATLGNPLSPSQRQAAAQIDHLTVVEGPYKLEWMDDPWADVDASGDWLMELAHDFRPELVHLNTYAHGALPWNVPVLMVGHSCVLSWWQAVKGEAAPAQWATYHRRVRAGLRQADLVVAPTQAMLGELQRYYGPLPVSQVIYNGRSTADFAPGHKEDFVFTMGRVWDEAKNIAVLDQIAGKLPWPLYVAGEQRHPSGGQVALAHLRTLGQLSQAEIQTWLSHAAIFVLPARYEPFGLAALEAALSQCALVLGDIPSLREVWAGAAHYAPANDALALEQSLVRLITDAAQRRQWAAAARLRAQHYTSRGMAAAYWRLYQHLRRQTAWSRQTDLQTQRTLSPQAAHRLDSVSRYPATQPVQSAAD
jgi:glycosyltransferase involved in cell wall biosynthesis